MASQLLNDEPELTSADADELVQLSRIARRLPSWEHLLRVSQGGSMLSPVRGRGMEYDESRTYQPGDDIRYLDSRATARRAEAYTKVFREEHERPVCICLDDAIPMHFATRGRFKRVIAAQLAAIIAWRSFYQSERISALLFDELGQRTMNPRRGRAAVLQYLKLLATPARRSSIDRRRLQRCQHRGLQQLGRMTVPGSLVFVISDFQGLEQNQQGLLEHIARQCDLVLCAVSDPLEQQLPASPGRYVMANADYEILLPGADRKLQSDYRRMVSERRSLLEDTARRCHAHLFDFDTGSTPVDQLLAQTRSG